MKYHQNFKWSSQILTRVINFFVFNLTAEKSWHTATNNNNHRLHK